MIWVCTRKYEYVHKRILWDLHREGGPWSIKKFEEKTVSALSSNRVDHGKRCVSLLKSFEKGFENDFERCSIFTRSFEKKI